MTTGIKDKNFFDKKQYLRGGPQFVDVFKICFICTEVMTR